MGSASVDVISYTFAFTVTRQIVFISCSRWAPRCNKRATAQIIHNIQNPKLQPWQQGHLYLDGAQRCELKKKREKNECLE